MIKFKENDKGNPVLLYEDSLLARAFNRAIEESRLQHSHKYRTAYDYEILLALNSIENRVVQLLHQQGIEVERVRTTP